MNVNIQSPMFQYSIFLSKDAISCLEYLSDNQGNVIIFADSYDVGNNGSLNFYRISSADGKNIKIPIYSIPAQEWISVVLINEDQRQVLFEEEPSFDYEFDDLDLIRNRNLQNPYFTEKEEHKNYGIQSLSDVDNDDISPPISKQSNENQIFSPVINIQNVLPENYQQTFINPSDSSNNFDNATDSPTKETVNRVSLTDEQMNGLLSAIDKLTNLFVSQQQNFNRALEMQGQQIAIQGQHLLQIQPLIAKLSSNTNDSHENTNTNNLLENDSVKKNTNESSFKPSELQTLLKNIPKSVKPFMPNISSGINMNAMIESLGDKNTKNFNKEKINKPDSIPSVVIQDDHNKIDTQKTTSDNDINLLSDKSDVDNHQSVTQNTHEAQSDDSLLEDTMIAQDLSLSNEQDLAAFIEQSEDVSSDLPVSDDSLENRQNHEEPLDLNEEEEQALQSINSAIETEDLEKEDISHLVSAIEVIQNDEHEFTEELNDIVQETNELLHNKDILHFDKKPEIENEHYNPSGALEHDLVDEISKLSAQAEDILSRSDSYDEHSSQSFKNPHLDTLSYKEPHEKTSDGSNSDIQIEEELSNFSSNEDNKNNTNNIDSESENNDDLLDLLAMDNSGSNQQIDFEPIPENENEDEDETGDSGQNSSNLTPEISDDFDNDTHHQSTDTLSDNELSQEDQDIFSLLNSDDSNPLSNDVSEHNINKKESTNLDSISSKINSITTSSQKITNDDFSLDQLDNLEALIQPVSKKGKNKAIVDDSENQDEFVSSQVLSYVFSDLDEDEFFETDKFLAYFESNNLHKAFGKINKDKVIYLVCKLLKNKNASPSKFVRPSIQKKLKTIMPDVAKEHWTGSITNIMDVFDEEKLLEGVNEIDICVWFVKNNFF